MYVCICIDVRLIWLLAQNQRHAIYGTKYNFFPCVHYEYPCVCTVNSCICKCYIEPYRINSRMWTSKRDRLIKWSKQADNSTAQHQGCSEWIFVRNLYDMNNCLAWVTIEVKCCVFGQPPNQIQMKGKRCIRFVFVSELFLWFWQLDIFMSKCFGHASNPLTAEEFISRQFDERSGELLCFVTKIS